MDLTLVENFLQERIEIQKQVNQQTELWIRAKTSISQMLEHELKIKEKKPAKELPEFVKKYKRVFEKQASE